MAQIRVRSYADGAAAVIEISDNGVGIAAELLPRIFDLFVQGDRTLDRSQGGLGIGLSVVRRLVEMHGGQVAARSAGAGPGFKLLDPSAADRRRPACRPNSLHRSPQRSSAF